MRRREFMGLVGGAATWPLTVGAQQSAGRVRRIGIFLFAKSDRTNVDPLVKELAALGYVDGKNVAIEYRDAGGQSEWFAETAAELVLNGNVLSVNVAERCQLLDQWIDICSI